MAHEQTDPDAVGKLLKGTALEAMHGESVRYGPDFIERLGRSIDLGVTAAVEGDLDIPRLLPEAERNVRQLVEDAVTRAENMRHTELDAASFEAAHRNALVEDCSWPFC